MDNATRVLDGTPAWSNQRSRPKPCGPPARTTTRRSRKHSRQNRGGRANLISPSPIAQRRRCQRHTVGPPEGPKTRAVAAQVEGGTGVPPVRGTPVALV